MNDETAIEALMQLYFDGLYEGDVEKLSGAFHPTAALAYERDGELVVLPQAEWFAVVRSRPSPRAQGLARDDGILSIDRASPTTAMVKVKCQIPPRYFTDYLSLLKVEGRWQVAQKVFATRTEPTAA